MFNEEKLVGISATNRGDKSERAELAFRRAYAKDYSAHARARFGIVSG